MSLKMKSSDHPKGKTAAGRDLFIILIIASVTLILAVAFDPFDKFVRWYSLQEEPGVIEEVMGGQRVLIENINFR